MPAVADRITIEELNALEGLFIDVEIHAHGRMERDGPPEGFYLVDDDWDIEKATATDTNGNEVEVTISEQAGQVLHDGKPVLTADNIERINQAAIEALCASDFDRGSRR